MMDRQSARGFGWWKSIVGLAFTILVILPNTAHAQGDVNQKFYPIDWGFSTVEPFDVNVGDTIRFMWISFHDIWIHPSLSCINFSDRRQVANATNGGVFDYVVQPSDAAPGGKDLFFTCDVGQGIHCRNGVNQLVRVFPRTDTPPPTMAPTGQPTSSPQPSPAPTTPLPSATPTTSAPTVTPVPTASPSSSPTMQPSGKPSHAPSGVPTIATGAPSSMPTNATEAPSVPPTTASAAPTATISSSPSSSPTLQPSGTPSAPPTSLPSGMPTLSPAPTTASPSASPSIATPSPTGVLQEVSIQGLEMTLQGISEFASEDDQAQWEELTALYQQSYYQETTDAGVMELETTLSVTSRRRYRRYLQDGSEEALVVSYSQDLKYRLVGSSNTSSLTPSQVAGLPFASPEDRESYVTVFLNAADGSLADVTGSSAISDENGEIITAAPTSSPVARPTNEGNEGGGDDDKEGDGLSTGAVIGIAAGGLVLCLGGILFCMNRQGGDEYDDYDDGENPYIPPSPEAFIANTESIEHAYFDDK